MSTLTPVSLSEYRARRQRPYPAVFDQMPTAEQIAEADEQHASTRPPFAAVGTGFLAFLFLLALVVWLARFFLKG